MKTRIVLLAIIALLYPWLVQSVLIDRAVTRATILLTEQYGAQVESRIDEIFNGYGIIVQ